MSLSDCVHCWETPCICGYEYRNWSKEARINLAAVILGINAMDIIVGLRIESTNVDIIPDRHPWKPNND
jgi:hypothetical protein